MWSWIYPRYKLLRGEEGQEQLKTALIESHMNTIYQPAPTSNDAITFTAVEETEKRPLSDAASALIDLSACMDSQEHHYF